MQTVTSGAVYEKLQDYQEGEWKTLEGNNISNLDYKELAISVWFDYSGIEIVYSHQFSKGMLGGNQVLLIGGYLLTYTDYGLCNVNNNNGVITLRNVYYAGNNYTASASIKIRYR